MSIPRHSLPLVEELVPAPDPWELFHNLAGLPYPLFLDSALPHAEWGRYSFICADPFAVLRARGRQVWWSGAEAVATSGDPWHLLAERLARWPAPTLPDLPPFQGGAAGLFGYDLCHHLERLPRPRRDEFQVPDLVVGLYDWVLAFDHAKRQAWIISTGRPAAAAARRDRAARRLAWVRQRVREERAPPARRAAPAVALPPAFPVPGLPGLLSNFDRDTYLRTIRRAIDYIHAGDCFQVNLAQRLLYPGPLDPLRVYGRLRARNPAPFAGYFDMGDFLIASASPERFLRMRQREIETRPIKGTRPRGATPDEDQRLKEELADSAKDRAENVMIVDLLRNDLGRVCQYGTIEVPEVCRVETYQYVHHLVSVVRGRLRAELGPVDLMRAAFPGGSVTGAPKVRAMQIIAELEPTARGPYCGCLGYIGFDGGMDTNILIRTLTIGRGWVQFPVGGGIVADSDPEREYEETWHKARGLLRALEEGE
ncbi:MAG: aminodeoxychorismate synthase component I [Gemmataceae bacterium]